MTKTQILKILWKRYGWEFMGISFKSMLEVHSKEFLLKQLQSERANEC